jgi:hypothetical protein
MMYSIGRFMALGCVLALSGTLAFAASMKADIPFTFHTPNATMAPGHYEIKKLSKSQPVAVYMLRNVESGRTVAVMAPNSVLRKMGEQPKAELSFRCAGEYCALATIYSPWTASGDGVPMTSRMRTSAAAQGKQTAEIRIPVSE